MSLSMLKPEVVRELSKRLQAKKGRLLETGTGWGESAIFFSRLLPEWIIYTVDGYGLYGDGRIYQEWNPFKVKEVTDSLPFNVIQILGNSQKIKWELPLNFLYIDADHTYEGCQADFLNYSPFVEPGGFICFDDYTQPNNPNNGVARVVDEALASGGYSLEYKGYYCAIIKKNIYCAA